MRVCVRQALAKQRIHACACMGGCTRGCAQVFAKHDVIEGEGEVAQTFFMIVSCVSGFRAWDLGFSVRGRGFKH